MLDVWFIAEEYIYNKYELYKTFPRFLFCIKNYRTIKNEKY